MSNLLTPKYLTQQTAETAVMWSLDATMFNSKMIGTYIDQMMCHIVVLVPSIEDAREADYPNWPDYPIKPFPIFERSVPDDKENWPHKFDVIARCKAQQLWRGQNTDGNTDLIPHLLFPDDTPFWGGVKRHGIVVTCSGVQPYFDQMISGIIADFIKGLAYYKYDNSADKENEVSFLT